MKTKLLIASLLLALLMSASATATIASVIKEDPAVMLVSEETLCNLNYVAGEWEVAEKGEVRWRGGLHRMLWMFTLCGHIEVSR